MKIAYIENEKAQVRQWHRILAKLGGDRLQITILGNSETKEEVKRLYQVKYAMLRAKRHAFKTEIRSYQIANRYSRHAEFASIPCDQKQLHKA